MLSLLGIFAGGIAILFLPGFLMKRMYLQLWHKAQAKGRAAEFEHLVRFDRPRYPGHMRSLYHQAIHMTVIPDKTE